MQSSDQIRYWRIAWLSSLICFSTLGFAAAQETASLPAQASTSSAAKAKHTANEQASSKHASSNTSVHASSSTSSHTSAQKSKSSHGKKKSKLVAKKHGQQAIDSDRAREIQTALIREHYIQGEPSGTWDSATQAAMQRYQENQGWQSKTTPDARALIKLGLGPSHDHLLNPESAMTTPTPTPAASPARNPKAGSSGTPDADNVPQK